MDDLLAGLGTVKTAHTRKRRLAENHARRKGMMGRGNLALGHDIGLVFARSRRFWHLLGSYVCLNRLQPAELRPVRINTESNQAADAPYSFLYQQSF